jgi:hypothetical protein
LVIAWIIFYYRFLQIYAETGLVKTKTTFYNFYNFTIRLQPPPTITKSGRSPSLCPQIPEMSQTRMV